MIKIYSPASIGNVGVGFDVLGVAIKPIKNTLLGDVITITKSKEFNLINQGKFEHQLPLDIKNNIVWHCWLKFCKKIKKNIPVSIKLEKNMPIGSGLGSSACSIVSTLVALNTFCSEPIKKIELLKMMGQLEGKLSGGVHYDNVSPCYLGGLQLILQGKKIISQQLPYFKNWYWIIAWPGINISTSEARSILPMQYQRETCIQHSRNLAIFIHALYTNQQKLAAQSMQDIIAEPYRIKLLPNFLSIKNKIIKIGAMACGISGSGPSLFSISDNLEIAEDISNYLSKNYLKNQNGFVHICQLDLKGTRKIG
ncbi:Homoserine kinase [Buchnera aphidicola (Eriosoma grossulariae)]|uniref:homoserine kinase n=1 Tax=Buchnera aphidicola TaxID=9 RepID=UPI0034638B1C